MFLNSGLRLCFVFLSTPVCSTDATFAKITFFHSASDLLVDPSTIPVPLLLDTVSFSSQEEEVLVAAREVAEVGSDCSEEEQEVVMVMAAREVYEVGGCSEEEVVGGSAADGTKLRYQ